MHFRSEHRSRPCSILHSFSEGEEVGGEVVSVYSNLRTPCSVCQDPYSARQDRHSPASTARQSGFKQEGGTKGSKQLIILDAHASNKLRWR